MINGDARIDRMVGLPTALEITSRGKRAMRGYRTWKVNGGIVKSELYGWLRLDEDVVGNPPPGFCFFPEYGHEYFRGLTSEERLETKNKRTGRLQYEWHVISGRRNEVLDCRVYARAAAWVFQIDRFTESDWAALERATGQEVTTVKPQDPPVTGPAVPSQQQAAVRPQRAPWLGPRRPGWLRR